jgi:hypothetical protein
MLAWMIDEKAIEPHMPIWENRTRRGGTQTGSPARHEEAARIHAGRAERNDPAACHATRETVEASFNAWPSVCKGELNGLTRPAN